MADAVARPRRGVPDRAVPLGAVLALHLLLLWALLLALRSPRAPSAPIEPFVTWLMRPEAMAPVTRPMALSPTRASRRPQPARAAAPPRAAPPVALPAPTSPDAPDVKSLPITQPPIDWQAAAQEGAQHALADAGAQSRRDHSMGIAPGGTPGHVPAKEGFPWGRQPLGKHYDIQQGILTLHTKRCTVAFPLFFPVMGFGCNPGRIDPEPGRGDLFDPKFAPRPLELPKPAIDDLPPH